MAKIGLCIGINNYPGTDSDLAGCVNDAHDWEQALAARGFSVSTLLDGAATGDAMRGEIARVVGSANTGDLVVVQYSGHGSFIPDADGDEADGTDECLCPHDIRENGPLTDDELNEIFGDRASGVKIVFIADSCHSGTVARFSPISTPPTTRDSHPPQRKVRFLPPANFLSDRAVGRLGIRSRRAASPPGRLHALLLSGCQDTEYSYDDYFQGRPNGAFTFVALQNLKTLPSEATYRDWHRANRASLPSQQYPQTPNLFGATRMKGWRVFE